MALRKRRFKKQSYKRLLKEAVDTGVPFSDAVEFRAADDSIFSTTGYKSKLNVGTIKWQRPPELSEDPHILFLEKLGPGAEIEFVGHGPNDWLIAAACALAQNKQLVYQILSKDQYHFLHGIFKVCFWNFGKWMKIVIDDKLPSFDSKLVFSSSRCGSLYWVPLIEKAYAKVHGSYERMSYMGNLTTALSDFTGAPVETIEITSGDDEKHLFRLIAEELEKHSLLVVKTRDTDAVVKGLQKGRYYLINTVKKPSAGSFKKTVREINASIKLISTYYDEFAEKNSTNKNIKSNKPHEVWFNIENLSKCFESLTICHLKLGQTRSVSTCIGEVSAQFSFDVRTGEQEVMLEVLQKEIENPVDIGYKVFKVEVNRQFKAHNFEEGECFTCESSKSRCTFKRIKLDIGRYVVVPSSSDNDSRVMVRLYTCKAASIRKFTHDMPRNMLPLPFFAPKYPKYVSRVVVKEVTGLDKQDRFGSANPYVVIHCGRQAAKSPAVHDSLSPDFHNFSAIFYHEKFVPIVVEVWHCSIIVDSIIGRVEVIPKVNSDDQKEVLQLEICDKKGTAKPGTMKLIVQTSEDLRIF